MQCYKKIHFNWSTYNKNWSEVILPRHTHMHAINSRMTVVNKKYLLLLSYCICNLINTMKVSAVSIIETDTDIEIFCHIKSYRISACWRSNRSIRVGPLQWQLYLCNALSPWWSESRHLRIKPSLLACGGDRRGQQLIASSVWQTVSELVCRQWLHNYVDRLYAVA